MGGIERRAQLTSRQSQEQRTVSDSLHSTVHSMFYSLSLSVSLSLSLFIFIIITIKHSFTPRAYRVSFSFTLSFVFLFKTSHNIGNWRLKECLYINYIRQPKYVAKGPDGLPDLVRLDSKGFFSPLSFLLSFIAAAVCQLRVTENSEMSWSFCFC